MLNGDVQRVASVFLLPDACITLHCCACIIDFHRPGQGISLLPRCCDILVTWYMLVQIASFTQQARRLKRMPQFQSVKFADSKVYVLNVAYQATTTKPVASVPKCIGQD